MVEVKCLNAKLGNNYAAYHGDCIKVMEQLPDECIDFSVYSPPFGSLFVYSDSMADMGNSSSDGEFAAHYAYEVREKFRLTKPGRITAVHCSDLPLTKWKDGAVGIKDFSGDIIRLHEEAGWVMHSRRTIWKSPVTEMTRTKHVGLLYKQLRKDSIKSRGGMPDYLMTFVKPGDNAAPIEHTEEEFPLSQWQEWASPVWMDIKQSNVLNVKLAREDKDERHLCIAEGSLVLTEKRGYVPIETIQVGENVLTHMGRWQPVISVVCNGYKDTVSVSAQGVANLRLTPEHKMWTRLGITEHAKKYAMNQKPQWIGAKDTLGSYINMQLPPIKESHLTKLEWWIIGRWLADGHRSGHTTSGKRGAGYGQFVISCGMHKLDFLKDKLGRHVGHISFGTAAQVNVINLRPCVRDMLMQCGEGAANKVVPPDALCLDGDHAEALLSGYLSGDGHYVAKYDRVCASSISRGLLLGIAILAQRARNVVPSIYSGRSDRIGQICGRTVNMHQDWVFSFRNSDGYRKSGWISNDGAWKKVRKITDSGSCMVYDIKVQDDESFVVEGAVVHNCPLQLDVIERAVVMWSNKGEIVFSPFMGIGSEGYVSLKLGRKFIGTELKESYWAQACKNLDNASAQTDMFSNSDLLSIGE